jgi:DNA repair ATPase RecN
VPLKIRVRNFQSIEDAELVIDGLTVVTGTNNAGKSAFFRAVRGALTNARGSDFVRHGTNSCIVDIEDLESGRCLTWEKGAKVNRYEVDGHVFDRVGHGVPPEARIFGVEPVAAGNFELWPQIAPQITGVSFLLHEPGSVIAEAVADVERVNQLGRALKTCESDRRAAKGDLKTRRADAEVLSQRRDEFAGLDDLIQRLMDLETRRAMAERVMHARSNLTKLGRRYAVATEAVERLAGLDNLDVLLPSEKRIVEVQEVQAELVAMRSLHERHQSAAVIVRDLRGSDKIGDLVPSDDRITYVEKFRQALGITVELVMRYDEALEERDRTVEEEAGLAGVGLNDDILVRVEKIRRAVVNAKGLVRRRDEFRDEVGNLENNLAEQEKVFEQTVLAAGALLGTYEECPTCGGELDHIH